jgi:hypothetical protein
VGGDVTALPRVSGAVGVSAGSGASSLYVTLASGHLAVRVGSGWRDLGPGTAVAIPS